MAKDQTIIVGAFNKKGEFIPHVMCLEEAIEMAGQQAALTVLSVEPEKVRTHQERKSIEVYCTKAAKVCRDAGIDVKAIMKAFREETEIPVSQVLFKDIVYKFMAEQQFGVKTTTALKSSQPHDVYLWCDQFTSKRLGFSIPWPSREGQSRE